MKYVNAISVILLCIIIIYVLFGLHRQSKLNSWIRGITFEVTIKTEIIIFASVMLISVILRVYKLGDIPGPINQDSSMAAVNAYSLLLHGTDIDGNIFPMQFEAWGDQQMNVLLSYLMIPWIKFFGLNKVSIVIPTLLINVLGMIATYFIVRILFSNGVALIYLCVTSCNPWHFVQARWPLESNIFPHIFAISLLLIILAIEKRKTVLLYLGVSLMGLNHYSYGISLYVIPIFLLLVFIYLYKQKMINILNFVISVILYLLISWPFYAMIFINMFKLPTIQLPFVTIPFFEVGNRQNDILLFSKTPISQFLMNLESVWNLLFAQNDYLIWSTVPHFGTMMKCVVPVMILGVIAFLIDSRVGEKTAIKDLRIHIILSWWIVVFVAGIMTNDVNSTRLNIALYPCIIIATIGLAAIYAYRKKILLCVSLGLMCIYGIFVIDYFHFYPAKFYNDTIAYSGSFTNALLKAHEVNAEKYVITPDSQYDGSYMISEVDTMFIWEIDSDYRLGKTNLTGNMDIPYADRFIYKSIEGKDDLIENAVYVITTDSSQYIDMNEYEVFNYGQFCTCIPKSLDND